MTSSAVGTKVGLLYLGSFLSLPFSPAVMPLVKTARAIAKIPRQKVRLNMSVTPRIGSEKVRWGQEIRLNEMERKSRIIAACGLAQRCQAASGWNNQIPAS